MTGPVDAPPELETPRHGEGSDPSPVSVARVPLHVRARLTNPFAWALLAMLGALTGLAIGGAISSLSSIFVTVLIAMFFALALDPLVRLLERRGVSRGVGIAITFTGVLIVAGGLLAFAVPATVHQVIGFTRAVPGFLTSLQQQPWFEGLTGLGGEEVYADVIARLQAWLSDPANLLAVGNGVVAFGTGLINGISGTMITLVLVLYFLASMSAMKQGFYRLLPAYKRQKAAEVTEKITHSVGGAIGGMIQLGILNGIFSFILLSALGTPYAAMLAFLALLVSMLPMVGSVLVWIIASMVCLMDSWQTALIFAIVYFVYMQIEAYVLTPRIMNRAVSVPGPLVLIGAMVGATLMGLLGALLAVPITASILILVNSLHIPRQDAKIVPGPGDEVAPA